VHRRRVLPLAGPAGDGGHAQIRQADLGLSHEFIVPDGPRLLQGLHQHVPGLGLPRIGHGRRGVLQTLVRLHD
jgi:hypothetical protein